MWPFLTKPTTYLCVSINNKSMALSLFELTKKKRYRLLAHEDIIFHYHQTHETIMHMSYMTAAIKKFMHKNDIQTSYAALAMGNNLIDEIVLCSATALPTEAPQHHELIVWDYQPLYTTHEGNTYYYVSGIRREHLLQYQLLMLTTALACIAITTTRAALLNTCTMVGHHLAGITDLASLDKTLMHVIDNCTISRIIESSAEHATSGNKTILETIGLLPGAL